MSNKAEAYYLIRWGSKSVHLHDTGDERDAYSAPGQWRPQNPSTRGIIKRVC